MERLQFRVRILQSLCTLQELTRACSIIRTIPRGENQEITYKIVLKNEYILQACKDVVKSWPGVSWNNDPLAVCEFDYPSTVQQLIIS